MEIVYLAPAINLPIGGIKVIYRHCELLSRSGFPSSVFHPEDPAFVCDWFEHDVNIRLGKKPWFRKKHAMHESKAFDPKSDFLVIPEVWANQIGRQCLERGLKYAIFVQNGYMIREGGKKDLVLLEKVYQRADAILSVSENTTEIIELAFPDLHRNKIMPVSPNSSSFTINPSIQKKKLITYLPKKLPEHAELITFFMRSYLPDDWSMLPIENRSEQEVLALFQKSAIFLSFSDAEGFALPPLEAALCGNIVVGYTGEGAKEYFAPPIFHEILHGDYIEFIAAIKRSIEAIDTPNLSVNKFMDEQRSALAKRYSRENELRQLREFAKCAQRALYLSFI